MRQLPVVEEALSNFECHKKTEAESYQTVSETGNDSAICRSCLWCYQVRAGLNSYPVHVMLSKYQIVR